MRRTTTLTALLSLGALSLGAGPVALPAAAAATCDGKVATMVVPPTEAYPPPFVVGTAGDDVIVGSDGDDHIDGAGGNDTINAGGANDFLVGGLGTDTMTGGVGSDRFDFNTVAEIGNGATRDVIRDFAHLIDKIDLSTIDANGAADFKTRRCRVSSVDIVGSFSVAGPAQSATVTIHKGLPTNPAKCTATGGGTGPVFNVPVDGCRLKRGKYWVTAQANMDFQPNGQWYWSTTAETKLAEDMWRNPGGGFGTACTDYGTNNECLGFGVIDYLFAVNKG